MHVSTFTTSLLFFILCVLQQLFLCLFKFESQTNLDEKKLYNLTGLLRPFYTVQNVTNKSLQANSSKMRYPIYKTETATFLGLKLINILVKMASNVYFPRNLGFHLYGQVLSNSPLCDTIIEVNENKQIFCHAAIISCASDILKELLDLATVNQNGKKVLNFTSACSETMFCVLDYIYTGREVGFKYSLI